MDIKSGQDLINLIEANKRSTFTKFYTEFFKKLLLASDKYVKDISVAEELVQDVFFKIWENPQNLQNVTYLKSYLYKSVINASLNYVNRQKNISQHHHKIAENFNEEYFIDVDEENDLIVLLYHEIEKLPAKCKEVFKLSRFDQMKYKEIAVLLNISERTVEHQVAHAVKALKIAFLANKQLNTTSKIFKKLMLIYLY